MSTGDVTSAASPLHRIQVENGPAFTVAAGEDALLRGALRAGLAFPYECSVGGCGACRFELIDGEVETLWPEAPGLSERDRRRGKRLACQSRPLGDCSIRVRLGHAEPAAVEPRRVAATLVGRRVVTPDISEFTFRLPAGRGFLAGQYALLYLPGVTGARAYSMSNLPDEVDETSGGASLWRFMIRRVPGGRGSGALFEQVALGDVIDIDGPYGHAWLRPGERDVVCIAGGSGLGPMLSVARGVLAQSDVRRVHFFLGLRTQAELGAAQELAGLDPARLQLHTVLSAPGAAPEAQTGGSGGWSGPTGFVHAEVERVLTAGPTPLKGFDHYFAGPPPMIDAVQELLMQRHQVPFGQIRFDRFI